MYNICYTTKNGVVYVYHLTPKIRTTDNYIENMYISYDKIFLYKLNQFDYGGLFILEGELHR